MTKTYLTNSSAPVSEQIRRVAATNWKAQQPSNLYWLHLPTETDPYTQGYIGQAENVETRMNGHFTLMNANDCGYSASEREELVFEVIATGPILHINDLERQYRPLMGIGKNFSAGGNFFSTSTSLRKSNWMRWEAEMNGGAV